MRGGIDRGDYGSFPVCWSGTCMESILVRGWSLILLGWGEPLRNPAKQRSANRVGVSTRFGAVSTGGSPFSSPIRRNFIVMERFQIRE